MAILTDEIREEISIRYQSDISVLFDLLDNVTKSDIRAAVDSTDQWVEDNKTSFNDSLPAATKDNLTAEQKSQILTYVVARRFQEGE